MDSAEVWTRVYCAALTSGMRDHQRICITADIAANRFNARFNPGAPPVQEHIRTPSVDTVVGGPEGPE